MSINRTQSEVITFDQFETTRPKRMRPVLHETVAETKTNYCETETETETKKWSREDADLKALTSL